MKGGCADRLRTPDLSAYHAGMTDPEDNEPSSPACAIREADDAYMGFADGEELQAFLAALIATEPAWRPVLTSHLAAPVAAAPIERTTLAHVIGTMLPRVRDDRLHADLTRPLQQLV